MLLSARYHLLSRCTLLILCILPLLVGACTTDAPSLPDIGPPPPPPAVSFDSTTLNDLGKDIERWIHEEDLTALANVLDISTHYQRIHYPDSMDAHTRQSLDSARADTEQYAEMVKAFWSPMLENTTHKTSHTFLDSRHNTHGIRLVFRAMHPQGTIDYVEILIGKDPQGNPVVVDMVSYLIGEFSSRISTRLKASDNRPALMQLLNINSAETGINEALQESNALAQKGEYQKAVEVLEAIPHPYQEMRLVQAAMLPAKRGMFTEEGYQKVLDTFLKKFGDGEGIELLMVEMHLSAGNGSKALEAIDKLNMLVHDPYLNTWRSQAYMLQSDVDKGIEYARKVHETDSLLILPNRLLFVGYAFQEDYPKALASLQRLAQADDFWPDLQYFFEEAELIALQKEPEFEEIESLIEQLSTPPS